MLQETNGKAKLSGYTPYSGATGETSAVTTLVRRNLTAVQHDTEIKDIEHTLIEIIPTRKVASSLFVLNVYSSPRRKHRFGMLIRKAIAIAGKRAILIAGDFNAHHTAWGYRFENVKGRNLWLDAQQEGLTLITDPSLPTRRGNSVSVDTTPDLTFTRNISESQWTNTQQDLGSDHFIIEIKVRAGPYKPRGKQLKLVEWDKFRSIREAETAEEAITDICEWTDSLKRDIAAATRTVPPEAELEVIDSRLLHMWDAKRSLQERWKRQRHNRSLRKKIAKLNRDIESHAQQLCQQQWESTCTNMENQLGFAKTWNLLRYMLDPEESKTAYRRNINRIIHAYEGSEQDILRELTERYVSSAGSEQHPDYRGAVNEDLDSPISESEIRAVLQKLNTKSAPGPDGITNKTLKNLDDKSITKLTNYVNACWETGRVPQQWKAAHVVLIPKPGKRLQLENLRPISLTSCLGKVMEHVVLTRLTNYLEDHNLLPHTMLGFRRNLSTQDAMLQIKHQVIDSPTRSTKAILGLDLKKAFDNVRHATILAKMQELGLGERTYNYVRDFLTHRKARLTFGELTSEEIDLGSAGTPQGSVISPMLFNIALVGLPTKLQEIEGLNHSLYADDITLWVAEGCDGHIEQTLQRAIETVEQYLKNTGLSCSAEKSELLVYKPTRRGRKPNGAVNDQGPGIQLTTSDGQLVPRVDTIRVLGLHITANGHNGETIRRLEGAVAQTIRLLRRIANRHSGMKEGNMIRLVQAFVMSRITYVAPYLKWQVAEKTKLDGLIRKAYKQAIGLPITTNTNALLNLGLHNTLDELIEAQNIAQYERLSKSTTGRNILEKLGIGYHAQHGVKLDVPRNARDRLVVLPLPKNMHPVYHLGRREKRAQDIQRKYGNSKDTVFVDAARYARRRGFATAVVDHKNACITSVTVRTEHVETAEEVAIALAVATTAADVVISDSQTAVRNFANGRVSPEALRILLARKNEDRDVYILWAPAHTSSLAGNEVAHVAARGLTDRAATVNTAAATSSGEWEWEDRLTSFRDITQHYRLARCKFPPPHQKLNKKQAVMWRQLQTRTFPNPVILNLCYPELYSSTCKFCEARATLEHMLWQCEGGGVPNGDAASHRTRWQTALLSFDLEDQLWAVQRAEEASRAQGLVDDT